MLKQLTACFGTHGLFDDLNRLCDQLQSMAMDQGVRLQLDPTFQPRFELYTGLVFQLVCDSRTAPVVMARGGRYDDLVRRCGASADQAFGAGFSLAIDPIRELLSETEPAPAIAPKLLVAFSSQSTLETALARQREWHLQGRCAVIELHPFPDRAEAEAMAQHQGDLQLDWIDS